MSGRVDRLVALGRLWAAVGFFHPRVAAGAADWDAAVLEAMPGILAAGHAGELRAAVGRLLDTLHDAATGVEPAITARADPTMFPGSAAGPAEPSLTWPEPGQAVFSAQALGGLEGTPALTGAVESLFAQAAGADGLVLDLRAAGPFLTRLLTQRISRLLDHDVLLPGLAARTQLTIDPELFGLHPAGGATLVVDPAVLPGAASGRVPRLAVVVDGLSSAGRLAVALRMGADAALVLAGDLAPAAGERELLPFTGELTVTLSLAQLAGPRGHVEFCPDAAVADGAAAVKTALDFTTSHTALPPLRWGDHPRAVPRQTGVAGLPAPRDEQFPAGPRRVLALYRLWATVAYQYPYLAGIEAEWEALLPDFLPRVLDASGAVGYHLAIAEAATRLRDTHAGAVSAVLREHLGTHCPPVAVQEIAGRPLVTALAAGQAAAAPPPAAPPPAAQPPAAQPLATPPPAARALPAQPPAGLAVGDEIVSVDGEPVAARLAAIATIAPASTPQALAWRTHRRLLFGPPGSTAVLEVRKPDGQLATVSVDRTATAVPEPSPSLPVLAEPVPGIAYVDLGRLDPADVSAALAGLAGKAALVVDLRRYPRAAGGLFAAGLARRPAPAARLWSREPRVPRDTLNRAWQHSEGQHQITHLVRPAPVTAGFDGPVVLIVDRGCISQGEHTALFLLAARDDLVVVGEPTSGANGNVASLRLDGGIEVLLTGLGVAHPDGSPLQRRGIVPDVPARRSLAGLLAGTDEFLNTAVAVAAARAGIVNSLVHTEGL